MKDHTVQATDQHHADEAEYQRRAEALTKEIYADLPAHMDEIVALTYDEVRGAVDAAICAAVKKIVERRLG